MAAGCVRWECGVGYGGIVVVMLFSGFCDRGQKREE